MPVTSEFLNAYGSGFVAALCLSMRGNDCDAKETNQNEIEDRRAQRYYGYDPRQSTAHNTMRHYWYPCRALDERISLANQLQLTPHRDW